MKTVEIELYSEASNNAIVRVPGRSFPGVVIQGDSLSILHENAKTLSLRVQQLGVQDEELLYAAQELQGQLLDRLLHDQKTLAAHDISLPYTRAASGSDLVSLVPNEDDEH